MDNPDDALTALKGVKQDFQEFCNSKGNISEADTRAKIIDKILTEVLGIIPKTVPCENDRPVQPKK